MIPPFFEPPPGITVTVHPHEDTDDGCWLVTLTPEIGPDRRPTLEAWLSLEFITWVIRDYRRSGYDISILGTASPPFWNEPGHCLVFIILGSDHVDGGPTLDQFAEAVDGHAKNHYVTAEQLTAEVN